MTVCELRKIDHTGDTKTLWDSDNATEVEIARTTFNKLRQEHYTIFHVGKDGKPKNKMTEFDPKAEAMIAIPPIVGG